MATDTALSNGRGSEICGGGGVLKGIWYADEELDMGDDRGNLNGSLFLIDIFHTGLVQQSSIGVSQFSWAEQYGRATAQAAEGGVR